MALLVVKDSRIQVDRQGDSVELSILVVSYVQSPVATLSRQTSACRRLKQVE